MNDDLLAGVIGFESPTRNQSSAGALSPTFDPESEYDKKKNAVEDSGTAASGKSETQTGLSKREFEILLQALQMRDSQIELMNAQYEEGQVRSQQKIDEINRKHAVSVTGATETQDVLQAQLEALTYVIHHGETSQLSASSFASKLSDAESKCQNDRKEFLRALSDRNEAFQAKCDQIVCRVENLVEEAAKEVSLSQSSQSSHAEDVFTLAMENHQRKLEMLSDRVAHQLVDEVGTHCSIHFAFAGSHIPEFVLPCIATDIVEPCAAELASSLSVSADQALAALQSSLLEEAIEKARRITQRRAEGLVKNARDEQQQRHVKDVLVLCERKETEYFDILMKMQAEKEAAQNRRQREIENMTSRISLRTSALNLKREQNEEMQSMVVAAHEQQRELETQRLQEQLAMEQLKSQSTSASRRKKPEPQERNTKPTHPGPKPKPKPKSTEHIHRLPQAEIKKMFRSVPSPSSVKEVPLDEMQRVMRSMRKEGCDLAKPMPKALKRNVLKAPAPTASNSSSLSAQEEFYLQEIRRLKYQRH